MISKNDAKYIQSLSDKKNRDRDGVFIAEGPKLVCELLADGMKAKLIFTTEPTKAFAESGATLTTVTDKEIQRLSHFQTAHQVVAVFEQKKKVSLPLTKRLTLALDGIQDPGNLGTIIRTADWFGISQIIASEDTADCYNPKAVQSTMGSIGRVQVQYANLAKFLSEASVPIFGAVLNGKNIYQNKGSFIEGVLVIGNESKGIREVVMPYITEAITIPRIGKAESLNAGVATGIILSHLLSSEKL